MIKDEGKKGILAFFERYRYWLGGFLLVLVLFESGYLLWRENYLKPNIDGRLESLESKISTLEKNNTAVSTTASVNIDKLMAENSASTTSTDSGQVAGTQTASTQIKKQPVQTGMININSASSAELDQLPGIGPAYAGRIIDYRNANGGFKSIDEIKNVKGIGDATFNKFKDKITI